MIPQKKIVMTKLRRQNHQTGNIDYLDVPEGIAERPKTFIVVLNMGDEQIKKDFCQECYRKKVKPKAEELYALLESIESIE
jgi:hypothetical protein